MPFLALPFFAIILVAFSLLPAPKKPAEVKVRNE